MIVLQQGTNIMLAAMTTTKTSLLGKALLNCVIGMGIVFVVLIFISYIISLLKHVPKLLDKFSNNNKSNNLETQKESAIDYEITGEETENPVEISLTDNTELVAVITAAIMASMGNDVPKDGLIVRSIRKINRSR
ncbi:MAG: OadG family protein [Anaerocolumna aminovalerica]|jgi:sodium pump decarboxylase gamma subunit|uniref:OadG family protein n=1 Tax=Anaerocolumna aminovalerica TaxID=1527 RepID=UPI000BE3895A|nr:OadG family protein [Anaerocolumna aminovalerica]MDU6264782.1 OadG family protein [Anaerocolumna aminovalerica]